MKIIERIFNAETNETIDLERDATTDEIAEHNAYIEKMATIKLQETKLQESRAAAEAKLAALGLTADDLKALGL